MKVHYQKIIILGVIGFCLLLAMFPIYYLFLVSVKPQKILFVIPPKFFFQSTFDFYKRILADKKEYIVFLNSAVVASAATILALIIGSLGAFAFTHFKFALKKTLFFLVLLTRMYPPIATLIPIYFMLKYLNLLDTRLGLIVVYTGFQIPLVVWLMRSFFVKIPKAIQESALLDGCSTMAMFIRIVVPLSAPGLAAVGIVIFVLSWNEFLFALVLTSFNARTAPVAVASWYVVENSLEWEMLCAIGLLTTVPMFGFMAVCGKYLIRGLTLGALKG